MNPYTYLQGVFIWCKQFCRRYRNLCSQHCQFSQIGGQFERSGYLLSVKTGLRVYLIYIHRSLVETEVIVAEVRKGIIKADKNNKQIFHYFHITLSSALDERCMFFTLVCMLNRALNMPSSVSVVLLNIIEGVLS